MQLRHNFIHTNKYLCITLDKTINYKCNLEKLRVYLCLEISNKELIDTTSMEVLGLNTIMTNYIKRNKQFYFPYDATIYCIQNLYK